MFQKDNLAPTATLAEARAGCTRDGRSRRTPIFQKVPLPRTIGGRPDGAIAVSHILHRGGKKLSRTSTLYSTLQAENNG